MVMQLRTYLNNTRVMRCGTESDDCKARGGRIGPLCNDEQRGRRGFWPQPCGTGAVAHVSMVETGSYPLVENIFLWIFNIQTLHLAVQGIAADIELPRHVGNVPVVAFQFVDQRVALR